MLNKLITVIVFIGLFIISIVGVVSEMQNRADILKLEYKIEQQQWVIDSLVNYIEEIK